MDPIRCDMCKLKKLFSRTNKCRVKYCHLRICSKCSEDIEIGCVCWNHHHEASEEEKDALLKTILEVIDGYKKTQRELQRKSERLSDTVKSLIDVIFTTGIWGKFSINLFTPVSLYNLESLVLGRSFFQGFTNSQEGIGRDIEDYLCDIFYPLGAVFKAIEVDTTLMNVHKVNLLSDCLNEKVRLDRELTDYGERIDSLLLMIREHGAHQIEVPEHRMEYHDDEDVRDLHELPPKIVFTSDEEENDTDTDNEATEVEVLDEKTTGFEFNQEDETVVDLPDVEEKDLITGFKRKRLNETGERKRRKFD